jgi:hypothetical protein
MMCARGADDGVLCLRSGAVQKLRFQMIEVSIREVQQVDSPTRAIGDDEAAYGSFEEYAK